MRLLTTISIVTLVIAVAALVLALWPVVADAPWENDSQLKADILDLQIDISSLEAEAEVDAKADADETEAERQAKCDSILRLLTAAKGSDGSLPWSMIELLTELVIENRC